MPLNSENIAMNNESYMDGDDSNEIFIHNVPENKGTWTHIVDLDSFFTRMYKYYINGGFTPSVVGYLFEIIQFVFMNWLITSMMYCINYPVLFNQNQNNTFITPTNITFSDVIYPNCVQRISLSWWAALIILTCVGLFRLAKFLYYLYHFHDIKLFYQNALKIEDSDLCWLSWSTILNRVKEAQLELKICIHKQEITELDIYQRILRFNNYLVAMVNKKLLPLSFKLPFIGDIPFFTEGLRYNIELLLFYGPWSPWENCWHLRDCYKDISKRHVLAKQLKTQITILAFLNLILMPFIQAWQIIYLFFSYAEIVKRSPGSLTLRSWTPYARISLRHFNELDHELSERLTKAYKPATKYLSGFPSPITTIIAKNITFFAASILAVLIALTLYDETVLNVNHMLTVITVLGAIVAAARTCIPEEGISQRSSEELLIQVLQHVHYLPPSWRGKAHTKHVAAHFQTLFQYRFVILIMELFSPLLCPFILYSFRNHALDIVDFYRNFTVRVLGIGDVCSFAQMDVKHHGHPDWNIGATKDVPNTIPQCNQGENGKIELSLLAFSSRNPNWRAPQDAQKQFLNEVKNGVSIATQNYFTGTNFSLQMNRTMLDSYYHQHNINTAPMSLPVDHRINSVITEDDEDRAQFPAKKPDLVPDKHEKSIDDQNMSISTLHLYDLHLAKMNEESSILNSTTAERNIQIHVPSTSGVRPLAQLSPFSSENTPLLKKNIT